MTETTLVLNGWTLRVISVHSLVVGSGAAGLKAAVSLHALGQRDVAIVTDGWGRGTSANAGSDKQTYYKVSLAGDAPDSGRAMAEDLFAGRAMHGDIALAEAQHSAQAFYHLVGLGVPFPHDAFGGFPGYRTDHDPKGRGTSAGPLTSGLMVAALGREVRERQVAVFDRHQVVALLVDRRAGQPRIAGALALDVSAPGDEEPRFALFNASAVVLATGGPGGLYADSVYPAEQVGSIGMALAAGATAQNLTESQFGLATVGFRWNVSGSYQQAIPRYVSTDAHGANERAFLEDAFPDIETLGTAIFRKGYQWPFDARRVSGFGSSLIDLLVFDERTSKGRRVFLDFTRNPGGGRLGALSLDGLDPEASDYLRRSGATADTPFGRLMHLNPPAVDLFREHGIDLSRDRLEIAVCAQHNNGGLAGNLWWESNLRGLFPVGEVNGSHGVRRPGGAALNAGQVGALRAAMYISKRYSAPPRPVDDLLAACRREIDEMLNFARCMLEREEAPGWRVAEVRAAIQARMTRAAAHVRSAEPVAEARREAWKLCRELPGRAAANPRELGEAFRNLDLAIAHAAFLESIAEYLVRGGRSRGSYLVVDPTPGSSPDGLLETRPVSLNPPGAFVDDHILEITLGEGLRPMTSWAPVRPIPSPDTWFETVWQAYRDDEVIR
jgi:succinate dehydrogenase/fumarate reductase flavoprotein subunit